MTTTKQNKCQLMVLLLFVVLAWGGWARADIERTILVDAIDDASPELGCTLREALEVANAAITSGLGCTVATETGSGSPIVYRVELPAMIYTLIGAAGEDQNLSGDLDIQARVLVIGHGTADTILDGGGRDRLFHLLVPSAALTIQNLTVRNGRVDGAGPTAQSTLGGAIYNDDASVVIRNSILMDNHAARATGLNAFGGAIHNQSGVLTIEDSILVGNTSGGPGGAVSSFGSSVIGDDAVTVVNSSVMGNTAGSAGGGLYIASDSGIVSVTDSLIAGNSALGDQSPGGGINRRSFGNGYAGARMSILRSAIIGNQSIGRGGGVAADRTNIANSTISGNTARREGGGVRGNLVLSNVTISDNAASVGGGLFADSSAFTVRGSIIAGNRSTGSGGPDCDGSTDFTTEGFNQIGINTGCLTTFPAGMPNANGDFVGTAGLPADPGFGPLLGTPEFRPLTAGSFAIDKIPAVDCVYASAGINPLFADGEAITTDQRNAARDALCDIGAFERFLMIDPLDLMVAELGGQAGFDIALPFQPSSDVTVQITSDAPDSALADVTELIFTVAQWDQAQSVVVTGVDDDLDDGDMSSLVQLLPLQSADAAYNDVDPPDIVVVNLDDDTAGVTVMPATGLTTTEGAAPATIDVVLDSEPTAAVFVQVDSTNADEGLPNVIQIVFDSDNWDVTQQIRVFGPLDDETEPEAAYAIELSSSSEDPNYDSLPLISISAVNRDSNLFKDGFEPP